MAIEDSSGYLGLTSRGVVAIHADWPIYPLEHGPEVVLISLGSFPRGAHFQVIADIDRCALLLASDYLVNKKDLRDEMNMHVALWHDDLIEAADRGWLDGVESISEREHEARKREALRQDIVASLRKDGREVPDGDPLEGLGAMVDGRFVAMSLPPLDDYDGDDPDDPDWIGERWLGVQDGQAIKLTTDGWQAAEDLWSATPERPRVAESRVVPLLRSGLYDTAVREIGVLLETRMRTAVDDGDKLYGQALVQAYINDLVTSGRYLESGLKGLRGELRAVMKFVRNEYAHRTIELSHTQALALIGRISRLLGEVDELTNEIRKD